MANLWRDMQNYMNPNIDLGLTIQGETAEQKRKRELDAYLRSASQLSLGPLAPNPNELRDKVMGYGVSKPWATAFQGANKVIDMVKGDEPILNFKGGDLYTDIPNTSIWYNMPMNFGGR
jgi:hypothetical protein